MGYWTATKSVLSLVFKELPSLCRQRAKLAFAETVNAVAPPLLIAGLVTHLGAGGIGWKGAAVLAGFAVTWIVREWATSNREAITKEFRTRAWRVLENDFMTRVASLAMVTHNLPGFSDRLTKVREQLPRVADFIQRNFDFLTHGTAFLVASLAIIVQSPLAGFAFVLSGALQVRNEVRYANEADRTEDRIAEPRRKFWHVRYYSMLREGLREFKALLRNPFIIKKVHESDAKISDPVIEDAKRHAKRSRLTGITNIAIKATVLGTLVSDCLLGAISAAQVASILLVVFAMEQSVALLGRFLGSHVQDFPFVRGSLTIEAGGTPERVPGKEYKRLEKGVTPEIRFKNVTFIEPRSGKVILSDVNFTLEPGKLYGFCGDSGAGKTTCIRLLTGEQALTSGQILVSGIPLDDVDPDDRNLVLGYLPQDFLRLNSFDTGESIEIGRPPDGGGLPLETALQMSAVDFLGEGNKDLAAVIGTDFAGARDYSGGETQRIALARTNVHDARVVILDEPTSKLGVKDEVVIFDAVKRSVALDGKTAVIISHRYANLMDAHRILVFKDGKIIEEGTHPELMDRQGQYASHFLTESAPYTNGSRNGSGATNGAPRNGGAEIRATE